MKVIVRLPSIFAIVACAGLACVGGCIVANGDGSNAGEDNKGSTTLREDLAHVAPNANGTANTATPRAVGEQMAPDFGNLAGPETPTTPSPNKPSGANVGFSTNTPDDPGSPKGDGPRPHPWMPGPSDVSPTPEDNSKPSIGGDHEDGTKPNK